MKKNNKFLVSVILTGFVFGLVGLVMAATQINLGVADDFVILGGSGITIGGATSTSVIVGDIGTFPTATITGLGNAVLTGTNHAGDIVAQNAKIALTTAYNNAEAQVPFTTVIASSVDSFSGTGYTLAPGIYKSGSTMGITGTLTLNGSATDVWIFQAGSSLTTAGASSVVLTGGARACNVFWQVGSSATLGAASFLKGSILALTSIGLGTTANVEGRILAQNGAITLDGSNIITKASCQPAGGGAGGVPPPPASVAVPLINVEKVPTPLALSAGSGLVTYDYTVSNIGIVAMRNVTVTDDKCAPVGFVSGDTNGDFKIDINETWKYRCSTTLSETTTNIVTATGQANGYNAIDTANATVVVSTAVPAPLIHLVKKPNIFVTPYNEVVTYTYTVTNPGVIALSNVTVVDDKCNVGATHSGDVNNNNTLDVLETWTYACQMKLTQTTTNTGTATGSANGFIVSDSSLATVVVTSQPVPKLPNTGIAPDGSNSILWNAIILAGFFVTLSAFFLARRKQIV